MACWEKDLAVGVVGLVDLHFHDNPLGFPLDVQEHNEGGEDHEQDSHENLHQHWAEAEEVVLLGIERIDSDVSNIAGGVVRYLLQGGHNHRCADELKDHTHHPNERVQEVAVGKVHTCLRMQKMLKRVLCQPAFEKHPLQLQLPIFLHPNP